jgi:hypothetical protein
MQAYRNDGASSEQRCRAVPLGRSPIPRRPRRRRFRLQAALRSGWRTGSRVSGRAFAGSPAHSIRIVPTPTASFGLVLGLFGTPRAGRRLRRVAASPTHSPPTSARSAARSRPAGVSVHRRAAGSQVTFDTTPRQLLGVAATACRPRRRLRRYRYGPGSSRSTGRSPAGSWRADGCELAATIHVGGPLEVRPRAGRLAGGVGAPVRSRRTAEPLRRDARRRKAHALGVLPRRRVRWT